LADISFEEIMFTIESSSINVQCKGVTIPFKTVDGSISIAVMVYI